MKVGDNMVGGVVTDIYKQLLLTYLHEVSKRVNLQGMKNEKNLLLFTMLL